MQSRDETADESRIHRERTATNQPGQRAGVQDVGGEVERPSSPGLHQSHYRIADVVSVDELQGYACWQWHDGEDPATQEFEHGARHERTQVQRLNFPGRLTLHDQGGTESRHRNFRMSLSELVHQLFSGDFISAVRGRALTGVRPAFADGMRCARCIYTETGGVDELPDIGGGHRFQDSVGSRHIDPRQVLFVARRSESQRQMDDDVGTSHHELEVVDCTA